MYSEDAVHDAVAWLIDNANAIGDAKRQAVKTDKMLSHIKAMAMKHSDEKTAAAQEREAYCSEEYTKAIDRMAEAAGVYETMKALREAKALLIEVWRSSNANYRATKL